MKNLIFAFLFLTSISAYTQKEKPNSNAQKIAIEVVKNLKENDYLSLVKSFDDNLKEKLTQERINQMMTSIESSYGKIESTLSLSEKVIAEGTFFHQEMQLEKGKLDLIFSLDEEERINNFRVAPASNKTPWEAPKFVDFSKFSTTAIEVGNDQPLMAEFTKAKEGDQLIMAVLVHGSGPNGMNERLGPNELFKDLAYGLASNGISSIRYNKRSYDYPFASAKNMMSKTIDDEVTNDAVLAIQKARSLGAEKVILIGHSLGGFMAPKIASLASVDGVISMAGNSSALEDLIVSQYEHIMKNDSSSGITEYQLNMIKYQVNNLKEKNYDSTTVARCFPLVCLVNIGVAFKNMSH